MYKLVFVALAVIFCNRVKAKDTTIVRKDPRLDVLTTKQAQINKRSSMMTSSGLYKGYRVQVLSTQSRGEAFKMKTDLLTRFPEEKTYLMFQSPNFKVRLGNYLKRSDAEKVRQQLNTLLSRNAYVVEDAVEYTPKEGDSIFL
ncbi:MAG: SPOR domain-containing protein [Deinococcales bacterium]|nr:SPOR domain-containing protein [Chitinophagaceae bacterium]